MPTSDLTAIIEKSVGGDLHAFGILIERFQDMAVGYAYSLLGDFQLAEDAAQEAFLDTYRNIGQLREPRAFSSWFRRIVFKHCDRVTRTFKRVLVPLDAVLDQPSQIPNPFEQASMRETRDVVHRALAKLPEGNREVVTLYCISEYTQKEIATYLGISVETVKRRLREGRTLLKEGFLSTVEDQLREHRPSRNERLKEQVMKSIAGNKETHSEQTYQLHEIQGRPAQKMWRDGRIEHSHADWGVSRVGTVNGEMIAVYGIFDISMRIGSAVLRVGGNNWGTSHPDYEDREDEIRDRLAADSFVAMRAQGYDMAANFFEAEDRGGPGHVFGWREYVWTIEADELPSEGPDFGLLECP